MFANLNHQSISVAKFRNGTTQNLEIKIGRKTLMLDVTKNCYNAFIDVYEKLNDNRTKYSKYGGANLVHVMVNNDALLDKKFFENIKDIFLVFKLFIAVQILAPLVVFVAASNEFTQHIDAKSLKSLIIASPTTFIAPILFILLFLFISVESQVKHTTIRQKVYKKYSPQNVQVNEFTQGLEVWKAMFLPL